MMKIKNRVEFVEEFRKITAIEKLPTLKEGFGDLFFENKADNNKFLRLKDEPFLNEIEINSKNEIFCENSFINQYCLDNSEKCGVAIADRLEAIQEEIEGFNKWSLNLNEHIKTGKYAYRFKLQKASPPNPISGESLNINFDDIDNALLSKDGASSGKLADQDFSGNQGSSRRFDFLKLNQYLIAQELDAEDLQGSIDLIKKELEPYKQYKSMKEIRQIRELDANLEKFEYNLKNSHQIISNEKSSHFLGNDLSSDKILNPTPKSQSLKNQKSLLEMAPQKNFKYLSILKDNDQKIEINYFRDIGPPSRNCQKFIQAIFLDQHEDQIEEQEDILVQEKIDTYLLHFLEPSELKMDKQALSFDDIANVSTGRVTSTNAHMCIRNEKVTRGQYERLLRKKEKLFKMQNDSGKVREGEAQTESIEAIKLYNPTEKNTRRENEESIQKLVEEISSVRKDYFSLRGENNSIKFLNEAAFGNEVSKKLMALLEKLYRKAIDGLPLPENILEIAFNIDKVSGLAEEYCDKKKLIWFIITVLEEIEMGKSHDRTLLNLQNQKKSDEVKVVRYKADKLLSKQKLGIKQLYEYNPNKEQKKSVSPSKHSVKPFGSSASPLKNGSTFGRTPTKRMPQKRPQSNYQETIQKTPRGNQQNTVTYGELRESPLKVTPGKKTKNKTDAFSTGSKQSQFSVFGRSPSRSFTPKKK